MPLQCLQAMYWPGDGLVNEGPPPPTGWNSITAVLAGSALMLLLMVGGGPIHLAMAPPALLYSALDAIWRRLPIRLRLLFRVIKLVYGPEFKTAQDAVHHVAGLGIKTSKHWGEIGQRAGRTPGIGENVFRQLRAAEYYDSGVIRFGQMHKRNLALELAHYAMKEFE